MFKLWIALALLIRTNAHELPHCFALHDDTCPNSNVTFWLYNNANPLGRQLKQDSSEGFDAESPKPLKVLIHGFNGNHDSSPNVEVRPELLKKNNINILSVDFAYLVPEPCYTQSVHNGQYVGRCLAKFLGYLLYNRLIEQKDLHLIGLGLGAHVAGFAADYLNTINLKIGRITGLDPAKPLFLTRTVTERLDAKDADFVDIIHTDIFFQGIMQPIGHVDFYPNKGVVQPKCGPTDEFATHECYHKRAVEYYAESIESQQGFWGFRCKDLYAFIVGECMPNEDVELLGYHARPGARGNYFLATNEESPYAMGLNFTNMDRTLYGKTYLGDELVNKLEELGPSIRTLTSDI